MKKQIGAVMICGALVGACSATSGGDEPDAGAPVAAETSYPSSCSAEALEADARASPWSGPGTKDGALLPGGGDYAVAATYLQLRGTPEAAKKFQATMAKINEQLATSEGLVAFRVTTSEACGTARTLSAYKDETAMLKFVASPAHGEAMTLATSLSRGKSKTTHWNGKLSELTFETGATHLATEPGDGF